MRFHVHVTDHGWFDYLAARPGLDEVNFWLPGGTRIFRGLQPGEPFLFKLRSPSNVIVGGGFFAHSNRFPLSWAWSAFEEKNGVESLTEMRKRTAALLGVLDDARLDRNIGCIVLVQPFFLSRGEWVPFPTGHPSVYGPGKTYDSDQGPGRALWQRVEPFVTQSRHEVFDSASQADESASRFGRPTLVLPRLGQGAFRAVIADVYERRCAVTRERTMPALEAAHVRPFSRGGEHAVPNGLLLRSDLHRLFDAGYVTIASDGRFDVSRRIREEFENGRDYYALRGREVWAPAESDRRPSAGAMEWHRENVFRG